MKRISYFALAALLAFNMLFTTAYGSAAFSGPGGVTRNVNLTMTCDANGNVK